MQLALVLRALHRARTAPAGAPTALKTAAPLTGTEGSNPAPSRGESAANPISAGQVTGWTRDGADKRDLRGSDESSSSILCITYMATAILPSSTIFGTDFSVLTEILMQMMPKTRRQIAGRRAGKGQTRCTGVLGACLRDRAKPDDNARYLAQWQAEVRVVIEKSAHRHTWIASITRILHYCERQYDSDYARAVNARRRPGRVDRRPALCDFP